MSKPIYGECPHCGYGTELSEISGLCYLWRNQFGKFGSLVVPCHLTFCESEFGKKLSNRQYDEPGIVEKVKAAVELWLQAKKDEKVT